MRQRLKLTKPSGHQFIRKVIRPQPVVSLVYRAYENQSGERPIKDKVSQFDEVIVVLGSRSSESASRAQVIAKHKIDGSRQPGIPHWQMRLSIPY